MPDSVNQTLAPLASPIFSGSGNWQSLGCFWISGSTLSVTLQNLDGGNLMANAIRVVQVNPTVFGYDSNGNVTSTTDALDSTTTAVSTT